MAKNEEVLGTYSTMTKRQKRLMMLLIWACWAVYAASMMAKKVYAVELVEVNKAWGATNTQAGIPLTFYYITYTVAQIWFALSIRKINVKNFFLVTVSASSLLLMLVALTQSIAQLSVVMALIGITHCGIWAGAIYLISLYVPEEKHGFAVGIMSTGFSAGNFLAYALSAAAVGLGNWQYAFWAAGLILLGSVIFLFIVLGKAGRGLALAVRRTAEVPSPEQHAPKGKAAYSPRFIVSFSVIIIAALVYQMLDMPVGTYLPKLFVTEHGMPESYSILLSMFLPVAVLGGPFLGTALSSRKHMPFMKASNVFLIASLICPVVLLFIYKTNLILTLVVTILYATLIRGFNTCSGTLASLQIDSEMNAGSITAFSNAGATVACAIVPMLFGYLFDHCTESAWVIFYLIMIGLLAFMILVNAVAPLIIRKLEKRKP